MVYVTGDSSIEYTVRFLDGFRLFKIYCITLRWTTSVNHVSAWLKSSHVIQRQAWTRITKTALKQLFANAECKKNNYNNNRKSANAKKKQSNSDWKLFEVKIETDLILIYSVQLRSIMIYDVSQPNQNVIQKSILYFSFSAFLTNSFKLNFSLFNPKILNETGI